MVNLNDFSREGTDMNKFRPTQFGIKFSLTGKEIPLHRVVCNDLHQGGIGIVYRNGNSIGSIELINTNLIINDEEDEALLYVKDILSDIVY